MVTYTVPGMKSDSAERVIKLLQDRLNSPHRPGADPQARALARDRPGLHLTSTHPVARPGWV